MRLKTWFSRIVLGVCLWQGSGAAEIVDRIDDVVDGQVIKESDILNEIRVTDFLNKAKLDLSLPARKEAASRLIDQTVIRKTMNAGLYPPPDPAEAEGLLKQVRQRYSDDAAYRHGLQSYGITNDLLKEHLLWQIAVLHFISLRFQAPANSGEPAGSNADAVNQQFFAWLDQSRKDARIDFKRTDLQ